MCDLCFITIEVRIHHMLLINIIGGKVQAGLFMRKLMLPKAP